MSALQKPAVWNFEITEGEGVEQRMCWKRDGVAVDLTGYTGRMQVRENKSDTDTIFDLTIANGGFYCAGDATGIFGFNLAATDTEDICTDHRDIMGEYDIFLDPTDGLNDVVMRGKFIIRAAVTR